MPLGITYPLTNKQFRVLLRTGNHIKRLSVKFTNCIENKFNLPTRIAGIKEIKQLSFRHDESVKKGHKDKQFRVLLRTINQSSKNVTVGENVVFENTFSIDFANELTHIPSEILLEDTFTSNAESIT